jgi:hypothetical protein
MPLLSVALTALMRAHQLLPLRAQVTDDLRMDALRAQRMATFRRHFMAQHNIIGECFLPRGEISRFFNFFELCI